MGLLNVFVKTLTAIEAPSADGFRPGSHWVRHAVRCVPAQKLAWCTLGVLSVASLHKSRCCAPDVLSNLTGSCVAFLHDLQLRRRLRRTAHWCTQGRRAWPALCERG